MWTNHNGKIFNIFHIHTNDQSEEVPLDVEYLEDYNYKLRDIKFEKDMQGNPLRYKFLVFGMKIRDVLYNFGNNKIESIPFEEKKISFDDFFTFNGKFGKITNIPKALLSYPSKQFIEEMVETASFGHKRINECKYRYFERLSGNVEF